VSVSWVTDIAWTLACFAVFMLPLFFSMGIAARIFFLLFSMIAFALFHQKCVPLVAKQ
jgi:hypothetical protein